MGESKTKAELINEIKKLRQRIAELEKREIEYEQIETKLRESEEKYRTLTESSLTGIFIHQDGKYIFVNDKFAEIHGYKPEELIGKDPLILIHPDDRKTLKQVSLKRQKGRVVSQRYEIRKIRKDGKTIWCETIATLIRYKGRPAIMGNVIDITQRKQAEENLRESEKIFKSITASAQDGIIMIDNGGNILYWNKAAQRIFGYTEKEAIGKEMHIFLVPKKYHKAYRKGFSKFKKTGHGPVIGKTLELSAIRKDGVKFPIELSVSAMRIRGKWHSIGIVRDITQRKQAEEQIKAALKEKEVLLREIHHRVKNNMQIVSSFLRLQSRYTKDKQILDIFKASQSRIESMAFIHEKLYQSKDLTRIDFTDYVNTLVRNLFTTYGVSTARIKLNIDIKPVSLPLDKAIPCGLIINELVSNSLKYAFPANKQGEIKIALHPTNENELELIVSDNGISMPEDIDFRNTESLGLHLVTILAKDQLRGKIKLNRTGGTEFKIKFKELDK